MYAEGERESVQRTCLTHAITQQAANALYRNLNMLIDVSQINNPSNTGQADMTAQGFVQLKMTEHIDNLAVNVKASAQPRSLNNNQSINFME